MCATIHGKGNDPKHINERFCWNITSPTRKNWNKLQPASGFPTIRPPFPHDMYLLEVDPSNSSNLRELSTEGPCAHTTSKKKRHNWGTEILSICWSSKWKSKISRFSSDKKGQQLEETLDCLRETRPNILETTILSKMLPSLVNVVQKTCFMFCHREISHLWENMWCVPNNVFSSKSYFFIFLIIIPIQNG